MIAFLSIHPQHAEAILKGRKWFEFRRVPPRSADRLLLYATTPVQRVVGYSAVKQILGDEPGRLWNRCKAGAGISREYFDKYFEGRDQAYAIEVSSPSRFRHPVEVSTLGDFTVPQSYRYLDGLRYGRLLARGNRKAV